MAGCGPEPASGRSTIAAVSKVVPEAPAARSAPRHSSLPVTLIRTARIRQWPKNLLVFAAPGAAGVLTDATPLFRTLVAFAVFCVVASGTYFINDAVDAEADRAHPSKRHRPIAAGTLSRPLAAAVGVGLMVVGVGAGAGPAMAARADPDDLRPPPVRLQLLPQASAHLRSGCHCRRFRAAGDRRRGGGSRTHLRMVSHRGHLRELADGYRKAGSRARRTRSDRGDHRPTLDQYSLSFLRTVLAIAAGGAIIGYCLWAFSLQTALAHHRDPIWYQLSIVPMMIALLRYTFLVEHGKGAKPEELAFTDRPLQLLGVVWLALFAMGVYAS